MTLVFLLALLAADGASGSVVNAATGEAIPHALVQCNQAAVFTDATGRFEIHDIAGAMANCFARKPGYFGDQEMGKSGPPAYRKLAPDSPPIVLKLTPASVLTGRVTDGDDEPLENVAVQALVAVYSNGRKRWQPNGSGNTDEDGQYRLGNLRPGSYIISASTQALSVPDAPEPKAYPVQVFYPNVADRALATPVELRPAQVQRADFSLRLQRAFRLTGTVTSPAGSANAGGVHLAEPNGQMIRGPWEFHPDTGKFEFRNLPSGSYVLMAFGNDGQGHAYSAQKQVQLSANLDKVTLALDSHAIPVVIRNEFANPPAVQQTLQAMPKSGQFRPPLLNVNLESLDSTIQMSANNEGPQDNPVLVIRNTPPGRYAAQFRANPYYVESAICGGVDLLRDPLVIGETGETPPIQVTLRDGSGSVSITVDGLSAGISRMFVFRESAPTQQPTTLFVVADDGQRQQQPSSRMQGLAPGNYFVLAFEGTNEIEYANPDAILPYMSQAAHFSVDRSGESSVTVKLIKRAE